jgi:hypothetical protein
LKKEFEKLEKDFLFSFCSWAVFSYRSPRLGLPPRARPDHSSAAFSSWAEPKSRPTARQRARAYAFRSGRVFPP